MRKKTRARVFPPGRFTHTHTYTHIRARERESSARCIPLISLVFFSLELSFFSRAQLTLQRFFASSKGGTRLTYVSEGNRESGDAMAQWGDHLGLRSGGTASKKSLTVYTRTCTPSGTDSLSLYQIEKKRRGSCSGRKKHELLLAAAHTHTHAHTDRTRVRKSENPPTSKNIEGDATQCAYSTFSPKFLCRVF